jgi:hypothetical protein
VTSHSDKRHEKRHVVIWNIYGDVNEKMKHIGYLKNLSKSGVLFRSKYLLNKNEKIKLQITAPEKLFYKTKNIFLNIESEIIHIIEIEHEIYHAECGAKFINMDKETIDSLETFLHFWVEKETFSD